MIGALAGTAAAGMKIGDAYYDITGNTGPLDSAIGQSQQMLMGMSSRFEGSAKRVGMTMTAVGGAITAPIALAVKTASDFETAITNAASVTGKTGNEFDITREKMSNLARELGRTTVFAARDAANAFYDLSSKGFDVAAMSVEELRPILDMAAATQTDLTQTTEIATSTLRAFGLENAEMARVSDTLVGSITKSAANMHKLGNSMVYVAPVARAAGISLEETTAVLAQLYDAGLDGSMAGTALRGVMMDLMDPSDKLATELAKVGINVEDVTIGNVSLTEAFAKLRDSGLDTTVMLDTFGKRGGPASLVMLEGADAAAELTTELEGMGGIAQTIAEQQMDTLAGQTQLMKSALEDVAIEIGQALIPALRSFVEWVIPIVRWTAEWAAENPKVATTLVGIVAASGMFLVVLGPVIYSLGTLVGLMSSLKILSLGVSGGSVAAGAASGAGFYGMAAGAGVLAIKLGAVAFVAAVVGPLVYGIVKAHVDLYRAQREQEATEEALLEKGKEYNFMLRQRGVVLDHIKMAEMDADEEREYRAEKERQLVEYQLRAWMNYYMQRKQTEQEVTQAMNIARNTFLSQEQVAILMSMGLTDERKLHIMHASEEETQKILEDLGVQERERQRKDLDRLSEAHKLAIEQERVNREATQESIQLWKEATEEHKRSTDDAIQHARWGWGSLFNWIRTSLGFGGGAEIPPGMVMGHRAGGGSIYQSGLYMVGERGPEIIAVPRGAKVYNSEQAQSITRSERGVSIPITIENANIRSEHDIEEVAQRLHRLIASRRRAYGGAHGDYV